MDAIIIAGMLGAVIGFIIGWFGAGFFGVFKELKEKGEL